MLPTEAPRPSGRPHPAYPPRLTWGGFALRQTVFNQLSGTLGAVTFLVIEWTYQPHTQPFGDGALYYFTWMQLIVLFGLLVNGSCGLLILRWGWRRLPDAQARYEQVGLFQALPRTTLGCLILGVALSPLLSSMAAHQTFIGLQHSSWGTVHLAHVPPTGAATLVTTLFGVAASYLFEYLHDRWTHRDARERLARQLSTDAQLQLLRAQLDPHMLFNTLSNLYELIDESPRQARAMLLHLIGFLRSTLDGSRNSHHALRDEFKLASDYLALMQIRMGERLSTALNLPEALRDVPVPAMLLQPLLENAIRHGLEQRRHGGELSVEAMQEAGHLVLRVRNSGAKSGGLPEVDRAEQGRPGGFGLHSVRERLAMLYGPGDWVEFRHLPELETSEVTLRLPLQSQKGPA